MPSNRMKQVADPLSIFPCADWFADFHFTDLWAREWRDNLRSRLKRIRTVWSPPSRRVISSGVGPELQMTVSKAFAALTTESGLCRGQSNKNHS